MAAPVFSLTYPFEVVTANHEVRVVWGTWGQKKLE